MIWWLRGVPSAGCNSRSLIMCFITQQLQPQRGCYKDYPLCLELKITKKEPAVCEPTMKPANLEHFFNLGLAFACPYFSVNLIFSLAELCGSLILTAVRLGSTMWSLKPRILRLTESFILTPVNWERGGPSPVSHKGGKKPQQST